MSRGPDPTINGLRFVVTAALAGSAFAAAMDSMKPLAKRFTKSAFFNVSALATRPWESRFSPYSA